jgi:hypothetical protein
VKSPVIGLPISDTLMSGPAPCTRGSVCRRQYWRRLAAAMHHPCIVRSHLFLTGIGSGYSAGQASSRRATISSA